MHKKKRGQKRRNSLILFALFFTLVGVSWGSHAKLRKEFSEKQEQADALKQQVEEQKLENAELERLLESGSEEEYIERIARDLLGFVRLGERVYSDIAAGN
jgi:cell division protein FtsB